MKKLFIAIFGYLLAYGSQAQDRYLDSVKTILVRTAEPVERFRLMNKALEDLYINGEGNPDSSYCAEMLRIAGQVNNDSLFAIAYNQIGNYFFRLRGDLSRALEYFFKGVPYAETAKDRRRLSSLYIDIAAVYVRLNNGGEAIKYIRKAVASLPEKSSPLYYFMAAQTNYYLSAFFLDRMQNDSALHYAQELNEVNLPLKSTMFESAVHGLMGVVYERNGDSALAALHMEKANSLSDSVRYLFGKIEAKLGYINYLFRNHKVAGAKRQALLLLSIGIDKNNFDVKKAAAGFLATAYSTTRQTDSAYYYTRLESAMKDSIFSQDNLNKIQALVFNEQLRNIDEENKRAAETEQRKQNLQYALIALSIIIFIILFLLLSRSLITNVRVIQFLSIVALLIVFEFLNLLLHPFLEKITHHSPVLMLLALVCIAALLVPLHHKMEKWVVHRLVEKNKQVRLSAAKKTVRLLSEEQSDVKK